MINLAEVKNRYFAKRQAEIVVISQFLGDSDFTFETDDQLMDRLDNIDNLIMICKATRQNYSELSGMRTAILTEIQYRINAYSVWGIA